MGDRTVRWERRGNNILLRDISYDKRAKESGAMQRAVELSSLAPIIMRFSILTEGKDKTRSSMSRLSSSQMSQNFQLGRH